MVKTIEANRKYWLVRTFGGKYYEHFIRNNYIAIGWNDISDLELITKAEEDAKAKETLYNKAKEVYVKKENEQPGRIVGPILRFVNEMNIGDIVVIPSENSKIIHFGIIKSAVTIVKDVINLDEDLDPLYKQRMVEWVTWRDKESVDLHIFKMLSSHYAISNVDDYAEYIDRTMYSFYVKGDKAYLVVKVGKEGEYTGSEIPDLINQFLGTIDLFNEITGENINRNDVNMKISLQSNGFVLFSGYTLSIAAILGVAVFLMGGNYELFKLFKVNMPGIIPTIWDKVLATLEQNHKHKYDDKEQEFRHTMEKLNVSLPTFDVPAENVQVISGNAGKDDKI